VPALPPRSGMLILLPYLYGGETAAQRLLLRIPGNVRLRCTVCWVRGRVPWRRARACLFALRHLQHRTYLLCIISAACRPVPVLFDTGFLASGGLTGAWNQTAYWRCALCDSGNLVELPYLLRDACMVE